LLRLLATNARDGPGIVLASVAFDAGIIQATEPRQLARDTEIILMAQTLELKQVCTARPTDIS
jgi:hypothetical protein